MCHSPLALSEPAACRENKRRLERIRKNGDIVFYVYWPGRKMPGRIFDISPAGVGFESPYGADPGEIIKIDAIGFKAVGEVVHARSAPNHATSIGVSFRSACFASPAGNFLDLSA